jgi:hypothetical protein
MSEARTSMRLLRHDVVSVLIRIELTVVQTWE